MKKLLFILLLAALTACNSNSLVNTPTATVTPAPTLTEIPERTSPFGEDGFIGEGKIGPWVGEANKVEPSQTLLDNVKKLSKDGEALVFEVKDAEGKTGQMVFVLEKDANGQIVKRFVAWNKDDMGVKRLAENGVINDLDELAALPDGQGFGVMGVDGILKPVLLMNADGQLALFDNFIQLMNASIVKEKRTRIKGNDVNVAFGVEKQISVELKNSAIALFEKMDIDPATYELKMDGEIIVGIDKATGNEVFRDGKFELRYAVEAAVNSGDLMPTKYKPISESEIGNVNRPPRKMSLEYFVPLIARMRQEFKKSTGLEDPFTLEKSGFTGLMLNPDKLAYGFVIRADSKDPNAPQYLVYETSNQEIFIIPLKQGSFDDVSSFWRN